MNWFKVIPDSRIRKRDQIRNPVLQQLSFNYCEDPILGIRISEAKSKDPRFQQLSSNEFMKNLK